MIRISGAFLAGVILLAGCSIASAQEGSLGAGKVELGGFPGGGTFFIGGDDLQEVNFNVYSVGADITYYLNNNTAVEGEFTSSIGLAQDVFFNNAKVEHIQMPDVWSFSGNVLFFPGGAPCKRVPFYITGGIGTVSLEPRTQTKRFGYDLDKLGWQTFIAENIGRSSARPARPTGASGQITAT